MQSPVEKFEQSKLLPGDHEGACVIFAVRWIQHHLIHRKNYQQSMSAKLRLTTLAGQANKIAIENKAMESGVSNESGPMADREIQYLIGKYPMTITKSAQISCLNIHKYIKSGTPSYAYTPKFEEIETDIKATDNSYYLMLIDGDGGRNHAIALHFGAKIRDENKYVSVFDPNLGEYKTDRDKIGDFLSDLFCKYIKNDTVFKTFHLYSVKANTVNSGCTVM